MDQDTLTYIKLPYPEEKEPHLKIIVPTCRLTVSPGIGTAWVTGRYNDEYAVGPLHITHAGTTTKITTAGAFSYRVLKKRLPDMKLSFGRAHPFSLYIQAGELDDHLDFGGIPLSELEMQFGAGNQLVDFSYPNPHPLQRIKIETDTSLVKITNLANANAAEIRLNGSSFQVNFGAEFKQNTSLYFGPAVEKAELILPAGTAAQVESMVPPSSSQPGDFSGTNRLYLNAAAREHAEPLLSIHYSAGYSPLKIRYV